MEKNQKVSYEVIIKNNPDKATSNIINQYWIFEKTAFKTKPTKLSKENNLRIYDYYKVIKTFSHVILKCLCRTCELPTEQQTNSQYQFLQLLKNKPLCEKCKVARELQNKEESKKLAERWEKESEIKKQEHERLAQFQNAIKRFENSRFNDEQARFMLHVMKTCPKNISLSYYNENYTVFHKFKLLELIHVEENLAEQYIAITYPEELKEILKNHLARRNSYSDIKKTSTWSRLSFLLEKNRYYRNSNTPRFSGTITFKEDVVIEKGTKCLYGLWDRDHDNAWLSLTPLSDIIVSENKPLHKEPEHIQDILTRFLNNPDNL